MLTEKEVGKAEDVPVLRPGILRKSCLEVKRLRLRLAVSWHWIMRKAAVLRQDFFFWGGGLVSKGIEGGNKPQILLPSKDRASFNPDTVFPSWQP